MVDYMMITVKPLNVVCLYEQTFSGLLIVAAVFSSYLVPWDSKIKRIESKSPILAVHFFFQAITVLLFLLISYSSDGSFL